VFEPVVAYEPVFKFKDVLSLLALNVLRELTLISTLLLLLSKLDKRAILDAVTELIFVIEMSTLADLVSKFIKSDETDELNETVLPNPKTDPDNDPVNPDAAIILPLELNDDDVDVPIDRLKLLSYCTTFVKLACFLFFPIYCFL
jgi:hypothetical protein